MKFDAHMFWRELKNLTTTTRSIGTVERVFLRRPDGTGYGWEILAHGPKFNRPFGTGV